MKPDEESQTRLESWMVKIGAAALISGIVFFAAVVILSMFGFVVPDQGKYPLDVLVALLIGTGGGFLPGGSHDVRNAITGKIPIPFLANADPTTFSLCSSAALVLKLPRAWERTACSIPDSFQWS